MSVNDITKDKLKTKTDNQEAYATGWDLIFGNKGRTGETYSIKPLNIDDEINKLEEECQPADCDCDGFCTGMCLERNKDK